MATNPNSLPPHLDDDSTNEPLLSREEGWDLIISMFGTAKEMYAEVGGAEAFMAAERAAWGE